MGFTGNLLTAVLIRIRTKSATSCELDSFLFPQFIGENHRPNKMLVQQDSPWQPLGLKPIRIDRRGEASFILAYLDFPAPPPIAAHTIWAKEPCLATNHVQFALSLSQTNTPSKSNILPIGIRPTEIPNWTACPPIALATAPANGLTGGGVWPPRYISLPIASTTSIPPLPAPGTKACTASQIEATAGYDSAGAGTLWTYYNFENISNTPCFVGGFPVITYLSSAGNVMPTKQGNILQSGLSDTDFTVYPKGSFLSYTQMEGHSQDGGETPCPEAWTMLYSIPGGSGTVKISVEGNPIAPICTGNIGVSPVAPGAYPSSMGNNFLS